MSLPNVRTMDTFAKFMFFAGFLTACWGMLGGIAIMLLVVFYREEK